MLTGDDEGSDFSEDEIIQQEDEFDDTFDAYESSLTSPDGNSGNQFDVEAASWGAAPSLYTSPPLPIAPGLPNPPRHFPPGPRALDAVNRILADEPALADIELYSFRVLPGIRPTLPSMATLPHCLDPETLPRSCLPCSLTRSDAEL